MAQNQHPSVFKVHQFHKILHSFKFGKERTNYNLGIRPTMDTCSKNLNLLQQPKLIAQIQHLRLLSASESQDASSV